MGRLGGAAKRRMGWQAVRFGVPETVSRGEIAHYASLNKVFSGFLRRSSGGISG